MQILKEIYLKYKIFIIPGVVLIISLAILVLIIAPQVMEFFKEKSTMEELSTKINLLNNKADELKNVDVETRKKDLVTTLTVLPTDRNVPQGMAVLQDAINKSNLVLTNTTYSPTSRINGKNGFTLTVTVIGTLSSIKDFMSELQSTARIFKVESATLNFQETGSLIEANIPITIFYEPAPKTLITLDNPVEKITDRDEDMITELSKVVIQNEQYASSSAVNVGKDNPFE
jgi:hypothetical protein